MRPKSVFTLFITLCIIWLSGLASADINDVTNAISILCTGINNLLPVASMLMILIAAVVYAAGQVMGAETRARANVWATVCITGALCGMLISSITPSVLQTIYGSTVSCAVGAGGGGTGTWTSWYDADDPGGTGDFETIGGTIPAPCPAPTAIECQTTDGVDYAATGQVVTCDVSQGLICINAQQTDWTCLDYKVRFLCP